MSTTSTNRMARRNRCSDAASDPTLFPLPLTPFELYMLLEDGPSHPMQFCYRLRFQGEVIAEHLEVAVRQALARHPLLTASVQAAGSREFVWVGRAPRSLQWVSPGEDTQLVEPAVIDIRQGPGVHIACQVSDQRSDLRFTFHHAACDGLGAMDFLVDVLVGYANATLGGDHYGLKPLDAAGLRSRGRSGLSSWQWSLWCARNSWRLPAAYRFYKRRPQPLFPHRLERAQPLTAPSVLLHHFGSIESRQLRMAAQQANTTVNTLLLRDLLLASHQLRQERGLAQANEWLRITVPLSMRGPAERRLPAANVVSLGFVDRCVSQLRDPDELLRGIDASLQHMLRANLGLGFLTGMSVMQRYPRTLIRSLRRDRCFSSMLFSNFGVALPGCCLPRSEGRIVAGNLQLDVLEIVPVLRPLQLANFAVSHYAQKYVVGMRYDSRHLGAADARAVLGRYVAQIRMSLVSSPSS